MKLPTHYKVSGPITGFIIADKTIDTLREHFFLAAHEWLSHAKLLGYSLPATGVVALLAFFVYRHRKAKGELPPHKE
jgi:hypothetical protein